MQRCEIIARLSSANPPSIRALAREYAVNESSIRQLWRKREQVVDRCALLSEEAKKKKFRTANGCFAQIEDKLYIWVDMMRSTHFVVPSSLAIAKAKAIAADLRIRESDFKASPRWLKKFRIRRELHQTLLNGKGGEVNKTDPQLLAALDKLCSSSPPTNMKIYVT